MDSEYKAPGELWPKKFELIVHGNGYVEIRRLSGELIASHDSGTILAEEVRDALEEASSKGK